MPRSPIRATSSISCNLGNLQHLALLIYCYMTSAKYWHSNRPKSKRQWTCVSRTLHHHAMLCKLQSCHMQRLFKAADQEESAMQSSHVWLIS